MAIDRQQTDGELVRLAQTGDRFAFGELYLRYFRVVHGIALNRLPPAATEDCVHEVFLAALQDLRGLRQPEAFPGWLCAIARRRVADHYRAAREHADLAEAPAVESPTHASAEAAEALRAIRSLPDAYSETLTLRLVEGLSGPEIAERTGMTPGSVRVNLHRGMEMLRQALAKEAQA
jgi:RNA polymerase sigma-70 factor (ECF subfamily)